ncbi:MAG: M3 family oligoendopeptidase [Clostridia bacterium]|nr:M3 family oligoendopeptidase [Clostridia bacterium]
MKFSDYVYTRPDMEALEKNIKEALETFKAADTSEQQISAIEAINHLRNAFETQCVLVEIRHSVDTTDAFYEAENNYLDEVRPIAEGLVNQYYEALLASPFKEALKVAFGEQIFRIAEMVSKTFKPEIIEDLQLENKLSSEYVKLRASSKIDFEGEERNLSQMEPFLQSADQSMRKRAQKAVNGFFEDHEEDFDRIYDELVKVRTKMAHTLGFKNFVELGYARLMRSDYDASMVAGYRKQVYDDLVPVATALRKRQAKRLGVDSLKYYDEPLEFLSGNACPKGDAQWIMNHGATMYKELSRETDDFFNFMMNHELMDLIAKKGKAGGGYCTFISDYKAPFIFSNFNGTSGDVDVLTHEAGHAFQVYSSRNYVLPEYIWPTLEACEIHSMSMEFLTWPWMSHFFEEETEKYKFSHLSGALLFIPYGVTVDEFQHWVYEHPEVTPMERRTKWREIESRYLPHKDYEGCDFLERGGYWFKQGHIFMNPFYYIDYTLAQVCAFEFWAKSRENREQAWMDYLRLCQAGGSKSFLELVELANLNNPFVAGTIKKVVEPIQRYLADVDDTEM